MDVNQINDLLARGEIDREGLWPRLREMESKALQFRFEFGLDGLPEEPGLIVIRGPRQYGKSTWLEMHLRESVRRFGKGSVYYLNGDEIASEGELAIKVEEIRGLFRPDAPRKRLFIDEITAVPDWERAIKKIVDRGLCRDVLIVTTGSKALDLRRGSERLPGRKGKLSRSEYIFLPISYRQFYEKGGRALGDRAWTAYLLTGGSPIACNDICQAGVLPEYFIQLTRDWIYGDVVSTGRSRQALLNLMHVLFRYGGQPVGYAKLAREAGLANNTVASGYIEQLSDLLCLLPSWPWNPNTGVVELRKPCKFHFINMAAVSALHPAGLRSVGHYEALPAEEQAKLLEWLTAQELWRRAVLEKAENPEKLAFWQSREHEIDFIDHAGHFYEVKRGRTGPIEFSWFPKIFPKGRLTVIGPGSFETQQVEGITMHDFLMGEKG